MCTSRYRPGSAVGWAMSIGASGGGLCVAGAAALNSVLLVQLSPSSLTHSLGVGVLRCWHRPPPRRPPEGRPASPAKARNSLTYSLVPDLLERETTDLRVCSTICRAIPTIRRGSVLLYRPRNASSSRLGLTGLGDNRLPGSHLDIFTEK